MPMRCGAYQIEAMLCVPRHVSGVAENAVQHFGQPHAIDVVFVDNVGRSGGQQHYSAVDRVTCPLITTIGPLYPARRRNGMVCAASSLGFKNIIEKHDVWCTRDHGINRRAYGRRAPHVDIVPEHHTQRREHAVGIDVLVIDHYDFFQRQAGTGVPVARSFFSR